MLNAKELETILVDTIIEIRNEYSDDIDALYKKITRTIEDDISEGNLRTLNKLSIEIPIQDKPVSKVVCVRDYRKHKRMIIGLISLMEENGFDVFSPSIEFVDTTKDLTTPYADSWLTNIKLEFGIKIRQPQTSIAYV